MTDIIAGLEKLLATKDARYAKATDFIKEITIGRHVAVLIEKDGEISLDALLQSFSDTAAAAESKKFDRDCANAALNHIMRLLASRDADG